MEELLFSSENHLGVITLNRTKALNALTLPMIIAFKEQLLEWRDDDAIHAVIIKSSPGKAFCAGGDVRWLYEVGQQNCSKQLQFFSHEYQLNYLIHHYPKPYIALMDGITMGGGVGVSLHGSHTVATENFIFAMPETSIGFFPDIGASYLLARCPYQYGIYLGLTGHRLNAEEAHALGLVSHVISSKAMESLLQKLMTMEFVGDPTKNINACINRFATPSLIPVKVNNQSLIEQTFSLDTIEGMMDSLSKGQEPWHRETFHLLEQKSPLSLKVTLRQLREASAKTFAECLKMDYTLVQHFMQDPDFYEGVRALLVEKDKSPQWQPSLLTDVTESMEARYFNTDEVEPLQLQEYN